MQSLPPFEDKDEKPEKELVIPDEDDDPSTREALTKDPLFLNQPENNCDAGQNPSIECAIEK